MSLLRICGWKKTSEFMIRLTKRETLEALMYAKSIRPARYTVLEDQNPTKKDFEICLEKTGVA